MIALCVRQGNPTQKVAHAPVFGRSQYKMPVIGRQLVSQNLARISFSTFGEDSLESMEARILFEDITLRVPPVQSVVKAVGFVGSFWSRHLSRLTQAFSPINDS